MSNIEFEYLAEADLMVLYEPKQRSAAFAHLDLSRSERALAESTIERLRQRVTVAETTAA
ncbi:MAG TPA: hypothetical protein VIV60_32025 [Polyangiaceae bacterium]